MAFHRPSTFLHCSVLVCSLVIFERLAFANQLFHIDFGISTQQTLITGWNNFKGYSGEKPASNFNLKNSTGVWTEITVVPTWSAINFNTGISGIAANYDGPFPSILAGIPHSALRDSLYVRDGESLTLTLNNLKPNGSYSFVVYGAAGNTGDYSLFTATGSNAGSDFIDTLINNSGQVAMISDISPDSMKRITFRFEGRRPDGSHHSPTVNADALGRMNFLHIIETIEPRLAGDYNADGRVDVQDYQAWRTNFGLASGLSNSADGNHDGTVNVADYVIWRKAMTPGSAVGSPTELGQAVPEPVTMFTGLIGLAGACFMRPCRRTYALR